MSSLWPVLAELIATWAILYPFGLLCLRATRHWLGRRVALSVPEQALVAPYISIVALSLVAAIPVPLFGLPLVLGLEGASACALSILWLRERGKPLRSVANWVRRPPAWLLLAGTLGLITFEVATVGTGAFPNTTDGSVYSLYVQLLLLHHTTAWTLEPFAQYGVIYPQTIVTVFAVPVLLFGWPISAAAVRFPPFFLGLSVLGAYCLGARVGGPDQGRAATMGLAFAAFFGLIGSWPRLFIGGSYDFASAVPLFLWGIGLIGPFLATSRPGPPSWRITILFGLFAGLLVALSVAAGEGFVILLGAAMLESQWRTRDLWRSYLSRFMLIAAIGILFVVRSLVGVVIWFDYPGHVLSAAGQKPWSTAPELAAPPLSAYVGDLDPFVPYKWLLSPVPSLSVLLAILVVIGLAVAAFYLVVSRRPNGLRWQDKVVRPIVVGTCASFAWTLLLLSVSGTSAGGSLFNSLASLYEASFILFIFYQLLALLPIALAAETLRISWRNRAQPDESRPGELSLPAHRRLRPLYRLGPSPVAAVVLVAVIVIPLGVGVAASVHDVPTFLADHLMMFANVSAQDVAAMEWAGAHISSCSTVFVAPGSAAQFLPQFATTHIDFPMMPPSVNLSYAVALTNLTQGTYNSAVRIALLELSVTEVFVTGASSITYPAISIGPLLASPDFTVLFMQGDAAVFAFEPGVAQTGCAP